MPNRLTALRKAQKLSLEKLAQMVGATRGQIWKLEKGKTRLNESWMRRLAPPLKVKKPADLLHDDDRHIDATSDQMPAYGGAMNAGLLEINGEEFAAIPRYDAALSAGPGCILDPEAQPLGYQLVEMSWLLTVTRAKPAHLALLRVDGDSMEPTLIDDDWVLVDRTQTRVTRTGIYALAVGDSAWIKRLMLDLETKKVRIISDNKAYPEQVQAEDEITLIGRFIVLIWRKSKA